MGNEKTAYMSIIDELVNDTNKRGYKNITEKGIYSNGIDSEPFNNLIRDLTQDERNVLVDLLNETEKGAIHGVLELLSWWIDCNGLTLQHNGEELKVDLSGMGLHGDYIGRLQGWNWPDEE